uniref:Conopeptide n=1 Tax=Conus lenavati TaxID=1519839 RepID=A0A0K8TTN8_CONLV
MSTLGMMLPILLLLLPLVAFDGDGPTIQGQRSAMLLKSITKRDMCDQGGRDCPSRKWCCDDCCATTDCWCERKYGVKYCVC